MHIMERISGGNKAMIISHEVVITLE